MIDLDAALDAIPDHWSPHIAATVNDYDVKIAKLEGAFVWHSHPETDEFFLVLAGKLTLELEGRDPVVLGPHQAFTVPRGLQHRPVADPGTRVVLLEPQGTTNAGDAGEVPGIPTTTGFTLPE
ncbi:cupin domain-containing protein [Streptacidiphilus sp. N1-10]|uniref:Cupin domain-containing protein n=1 Tax=Streptacidiphilus jeojiensis TaxID=3229225 RepID=A0ABV6XRY0_9ACTN